MSATTTDVRCGAGFNRWQARRRIACGSSRADVLVAAANSAALGDAPLAVALIAHALRGEVIAAFRGCQPYVPGDVTRRVVGALGIDIDAAIREYRALIETLMPGTTRALSPHASLRTLARLELAAVDVGKAAEAFAEEVVRGEPYDHARDVLLTQLYVDAAGARQREFNWLAPLLELRFAPGDDGLGRLGARGAGRGPSTPISAR